MFIWALTNWRIIALIFAVLSFLGGLWGYGHAKYREGYNKAISEVAAAKARADEQTRKEQSVIKKKSQEVEDEIYKSPDGDIPDVIRDQLRRMRNER